MKALILIGGHGTRLRPLTLSIPKPLVEFCNRPMLMHQVEALVEFGVESIILAIHKDSIDLEEYIKEICQETIKDRNVDILFSYESEHLGTAGPLAQAAPLLGDDDEPFFVLNSDIICSFPFTKMIDFHKTHGHEGTMVVTKVDEPSRYGAVIFNDNSGMITRFIEKPNDYVASRINAGLYVFNRSILKRVSPKPMSIEMEVFPQMVDDGELYCTELTGYWMDVGLPTDFIHAMRLYLGYLYESKSDLLTTHQCFLGNVLMDPTVKVGKDCRIGPNVTIAAGVVIENGVRIRNTAILTGCVIRSHAWLDCCIIGWKSVVGKWVRIENGTVLGEDVKVADELVLNGALILPHNAISRSVFEPQVIM